MQEDIKNKWGRPTEYNQNMAERICDRLVEWESLRSICLDEDMPAKGTVLKWVARHKEFEDQYTRAKEHWVEWLVEEIFEIADDTSKDYIYWIDEDGNETKRLDSEHIQRSRLRVDTRKWYVWKVKPKKYWDKIAIWWADDLPPVQVEDVSALTLKQLDEERKKLLW